MAAAAIPLAASALAPEVAGVVTPMLGASLAASAPWLAPAIAGAGLSGIGGLLTGQNPLKAALLGGIGSGISSAVMPNGLGGLFDGGKSSAPGALEQVSPDLAGVMSKADSSVTGGVADASQYTNPSSGTGGLFSGGLGKYAAPAALAGGAYLLNGATAPKTLGPTMPGSPSNPGQVSPLMRTAQNVDPNSYFAPSTAANRSYYAPYTMQPQFMARGGIVRKFKNGGSSSASSSNVPPSSVGGKLVNTKIKNPSMYPVKGKNSGTFRYYADGGPAGLGAINGPGDGQSDSIPAQLSDGEFVVSAPVVSALGNGSNNAGAKKLGMMQHKVLQKHYKGGKPHKAIGLSSYVH